MPQTVTLVAFGLLFIQGTVGSDDLQTRCDTVMDSIPLSFVTNVQYQVQIEDATGKQINFTSDFYESVDYLNKKSFTEITEVKELSGGASGDMSIIKNKYIWNEAMMQTDSDFLHINTISRIESPDKSEVTCKINDFAQDPFIGIIMGIFNRTSTNRPSSFDVLDFGPDMGYQCDSTVVQYGVNNIVFSKKVSTSTSSLDIVYEWLDPKYELSRDETDKTISIPVIANVDGFIIVNNQKYFVHILLDYHNFIPAPAPSKEFQPPEDIWCENRNASIHLDIIMPTSFSFTSESIYYGQTGGIPLENDPLLILPTQEWYDYELDMSKSYYVSPQNSIEKSQENFVTSIRDFRQGLRYLINYQNCTITPLANVTSSSGRIIHTPDGKVLLPSVYDYFKLEDLYNDNGYDMVRGLEMTHYQTSSQTDVSIGPVSTVISMTAQTVNIINSDGEAELERPASMEIYEQSYYNDETMKLKQNIFGFDGTDLDPSTFDTVACFEDDDMDDKEIRFPIDQEDFSGVSSTPAVVIKAIRKALAKAGNVQATRIQNIQYDYNKNDGMLYTTYTAVDFPVNQLSEEDKKVIGYDTMDESVKKPLKDVVNDIGNAVAQGTVSFTFNDKTSNRTVSAKADSDFYISISGTNDGNDYSVKYTYGYTGGAMFGMAVGMFLIGAILVGGAYYGYLRHRGIAPNTSRSFDNPMSMSGSNRFD